MGFVRGTVARGFGLKESENLC